ncbi:hypothetical protein COB64_02470 [Candidatus Wolfebacteria bacterium]|nr:MAG: hypothetical protein COB64_02470 [Candidatus Wolfebacteria bacterium]
MQGFEKIELHIAKKIGSVLWITAMEAKFNTKWSREDLIPVSVNTQIGDFILKGENFIGEMESLMNITKSADEFLGSNGALDDVQRCVSKMCSGKKLITLIKVDDEILSSALWELQFKE